MDRLPDEITSDILARLPFKSMGRNRCVSKLWSALFSDSKFPNLQLTHFSRISPDILVYCFKSSIHRPTLFYVEDRELCDEIAIKPFKVSETDFLGNSICEFFRILGSCNGFVCLTYNLNESDRPCYPIYIFNPLTEIYAKLPNFMFPECDIPDRLKDDKRLVLGKNKKIQFCLSGFGFVDSTKQFKVALVIFAARDYENQIFSNEVQIHTLGSTTWRRKVGIVPHILLQALPEFSVSSNLQVSTLFHECLHWITWHSPKDFGLSIVSFNLGVEEFGFVPTPNVHVSYLPYSHYDLRVLEDCLCLVDCSFGMSTQIWVMNKYNVKESWVKRFLIEHQSVFHRNNISCKRVTPVKLCNNGELLLLCDRKKLILYNPTNQRYRVLEVEGARRKLTDPVIVAESLVGSFISPKAVCGMDVSEELQNMA